MKRLPERGLIAPIVLAILILTSGLLVRRLSLEPTAKVRAEIKLARELAAAREALIAYGSVDPHKPGRLPCPDIAKSGSSPLLVGNDCPAYAGGLPWRTLGLPESGSGQAFRYVLAPEFGGDHAQPINSDTTATLVFAGQGDLVAIISAPHAAPDLPGDAVMVVSRGELMASVEQRLASALRSCLEQHATAPENVTQAYPWPAPLAAENFAGSTGSLFGNVARTQPGNPEIALANQINSLRSSLVTLNAAAIAAPLGSTLLQLQQEAARFLLQAERLHAAATNLDTKARAATAALQTLDAQLVNAARSRSALNELGGTLPGDINVALPTLGALADAVSASGIDAFLLELTSQDANLQGRIASATNSDSSAPFDKLLTAINIFHDKLFNAAWTPNLNIDMRLESAYLAAASAITAVNTARGNFSRSTADAAIAASQSLHAAILALAGAVRAQRTSLDGGEIAFLANRLEQLIQENSATSTSTLISGIDTAMRVLQSPLTLPADIAAIRERALAALAKANTQSAQNQENLALRQAAGEAASSLRDLSRAIDLNGDNITLATLRLAFDRLSAGSAAVPKTLDATEALRSPVKTSLYWSGVVIAAAADLARNAKRSIGAANEGENSAFSAANRLIAQLDGDTGSIALIESALRKPSDAALANARESLSRTIVLLDALLQSAEKLLAASPSGLASAALPTIWYGNQCAFLQAPAGSSDWWTSNAWAPLIFYQISDRYRPKQGDLSVDGQANRRVVAIAAGAALPGKQDRTRRSIGQYLEGQNADASRDGQAMNAARSFSRHTPNSSINDRIAD